MVSRGGTLFQSVLPAGVTSASYDPANRLMARTAAGVTASPTWDANGNLTSDGVRSYAWDARNRLTAIAGVASFVYDALGRRQTAIRGGTATSFLYDGWDVAQEQQGGTPSADLLLGLGVDERFARNGVTFLTDAQGSTMALATSGSVQTSYGYDPYGVSQATGVGSDNPYQYTGRENDGSGLLHYRGRYYNPAWARFVSEDPIGLRGGINVYAYVASNPMGLVDPMGLSNENNTANGYPEPGQNAIRSDVVQTAAMTGAIARPMVTVAILAGAITGSPEVTAVMLSSFLWPAEAAAVYDALTGVGPPAAQYGVPQYLSNISMEQAAQTMH